jgi:uncharacterized protein YbjT (DUF2867 family)
MSPAARAVLLTGATGFVGKVVLYELLRRREELGIERVRPGVERETAPLSLHRVWVPTPLRLQR